MIRIFLTNLGNYTEGELIGEWLELPASKEAINSTLKRIGSSDCPDSFGRIYEEYFISDYETDISGLTIPEFCNLNDLNDLAEVINSFTSEEQAVAGAIFAECPDWEKALQIISDHEYTFYEGADDMEAVAIDYVNDTGLLDNAPDVLKLYFDYASFGETMEIEGYFVRLGHGYLNIDGLVA